MAQNQNKNQPDPQALKATERKYIPSLNFLNFLIILKPFALNSAAQIYWNTPSSTEVRGFCWTCKFPLKAGSLITVLTSSPIFRLLMRSIFYKAKLEQQTAAFIIQYFCSNPQIGCNPRKVTTVIAPSELYIHSCKWNQKHPGENTDLVRLPHPFWWKPTSCAENLKHVSVWQIWNGFLFLHEKA